VIFVPPSCGLSTVPAASGTPVPDAVLLSRPAPPSSRNVAERSRWAPVDTPLAAAEVLDPVGSDRKMPTDR
jgi:hypothetical protein